MIKFRVSTLEHIADMICGNEGKFSKHFPYRSSSYLTRFFRDCDLDHTHGWHCGTFVGSAVFVSHPGKSTAGPKRPAAAPQARLREAGPPARAADG